MISGNGRDSPLAARICGRLNAAAEIVLVPAGRTPGDAGDAVRGGWNIEGLGYSGGVPYADEVNDAAGEAPKAGRGCCKLLSCGGV